MIYSICIYREYHYTALIYYWLIDDTLFTDDIDRFRCLFNFTISGPLKREEGNESRDNRHHRETPAIGRESLQYRTVGSLRLTNGNTNIVSPHLATVLAPSR